VGKHNISTDKNKAKIEKYICLFLSVDILFLSVDILLLSIDVLLPLDTQEKQNKTPTA